MNESKTLGTENAIESASGLKQRALEAIASKDVEQLILALQDINQKLIGSDNEGSLMPGLIFRLREQLTEFFQKIEKFGFSEDIVVYLGDSNYRLVVGINLDKSPKLIFTGNQIYNYKEIKDSWDKL
ncbi:MAG: hypothetical protein WCW25_04375 [Patescibacteria group bacterium]|jgi:hypothetical protein